MHAIAQCTTVPCVHRSEGTPEKGLCPTPARTLPLGRSVAFSFPNCFGFKLQNPLRSVFFHASPCAPKTEAAAPVKTTTTNIAHFKGLQLEIRDRTGTVRQTSFQQRGGGLLELNFAKFHLSLVKNRGEVAPGPGPRRFHPKTIPFAYY